MLHYLRRVLPFRLSSDRPGAGACQPQTGSTGNEQHAALPVQRDTGDTGGEWPGHWQQLLDANRGAFMNDFVTRAEFVGLYPITDTPAQYVDRLYLHANLTPTIQERLDSIAEFGGAATAGERVARGRALLLITQHPVFQARELNRSFVQMQYFGYLRRNPNDAPDGNFNGYDFWLNKLKAADGNFITSEMVKAFFNSIEYRERFGP